MKKRSADAINLADALHSAAIHLLRHLRKEDRASGIGPAQLSALSVLVFGGSMSLGDLAAAEQVKPPTMVRIVRSLAKQRLVKARANKQDRRKIKISATTQGRALMLRARQLRVQALAERIAALSESEQDHLRSALAVLGDLLRDWRSSSSTGPADA
jgi:DNA-binding MarR family transcriptional regulator